MPRRLASALSVLTAVAVLWAALPLGVAGTGAAAGFRGRATVVAGAPAPGTLGIWGPPATNTPDVFLLLYPAAGSVGLSAEVSNDGTSWTAIEHGERVPWTLEGADGVKTVSARWRDGADGVSDAVTANVLLDRVAPTVTTPTRPAIVVPQTTGASVLSERFSWSGGDDRSGVLWFEVERSVNGNSWTSVALATTTTMAAATPFNASVRYRVRTVDAARNASPWAYAPTVTPTRVQNTAGSLTWRGRWITASASSFLGGSSRWARANGSSVSYRFTGRSIAWATSRFGSSAKAKIYIDGSYVKTVSLYTTGSAQYRRILYARTWPSSGTHTIRIVSVNAYGNTRVDMDAFIRQ